MGRRAGESRSYDYGWDSIQVGESHFKFKRPLSRMRDAWNAYKRKRPELAGVRIVFEETPKGVIYRRVE
jgi:hypothetical protein